MIEWGGHTLSISIRTEPDVFVGWPTMLRFQKPTCNGKVLAGIALIISGFSVT